MKSKHSERVCAGGHRFPPVRKFPLYVRPLQVILALGLIATAIGFFFGPLGVWQWLALSALFGFPGEWLERSGYVQCPQCGSRSAVPVWKEQDKSRLMTRDP